MKDTLIYVVAHNHKEFLKDCLNSVYSQIDNETDVILIDSGSTDGSYEHLKNYSKEKNFDFYNKKLILTEIIDWVYIKFCSKYKYIMRVDADDVLIRNSIKLLKTKIKEDESIGSVSGSWIEIDSNSNILNKMILNDGEATSAFHGACTLFNTNAIRKLRFANNNIKSQDGLYTWLKISTKWRCITISNYIFQYRRHENNMSNEEEKLFSGRNHAYKSVFKEKKFKSSACVIIGHTDDSSLFVQSRRSQIIENFKKQLQYIEDCESISSAYISTNSRWLKDINFDIFPKLKILDRNKSSNTLIKSLQDCQNIQKVMMKYDDIFIINPNKNLWSADFMGIALYSKYIHSYKTVIACKLIKGAAFNEEDGKLQYINFSNLNTVFTSKFLFVRLPGFLLVNCKDFNNIHEDFPKPIGQVSNNFLKMGINTL